MELTLVKKPTLNIEDNEHGIPNEVPSMSSHFIEANTVESTLNAIRDEHIVPVFIKDNEPVISHSEFITSTLEIVSDVFGTSNLLNPSIRLSHPIKGRIPQARTKPAIELLEHEKTLYYERMAFVIEVPSIQSIVDGNLLSLTIGGVKAYNLDNLYNTCGADQHFKVFIGFQNKVCTNMCVSTDGALSQLKVKNISQLKAAIHTLISGYNIEQFTNEIQSFPDYVLTEQQFVQLIGRCRLYKHMPERLKGTIRELRFGDNQINNVCKEYYSDQNFRCNDDGSINLWRVYNLLTGANKSSYIDSFVDRSINAYELTRDIKYSLQTKTPFWFIN